MPPDADRQRVLLIAFHYPPVAVSSGLQRTLSFSIDLRSHGWEPLVLTVSPRAYLQVSDDQLGDIPAGLTVARAFCLDSARHLAIKGWYPGWLAQPDRWVSWLPAGIWRGLQLIRRHRPAVIMSTYPLATAHLLGYILSKITGLPWVADFRDSMTEPGYPRDPATRRIYCSLETRFVHRCARAVFTTGGARQMYAERYPHINSSVWAVIANGFDEENFRAAESGYVPTPAGRKRPLTLVHSGTLYTAERDPEPFFSALRELHEAGEVSAENLRIRLRATGSDGKYARVLAEHGLEGIVLLEPSVGYRAALREMLDADGLLLFQGAECNHQVPAKLYEYMRAGRPILALTDRAGDTAQTLRGAGVTSIFDMADRADIARGLRTFLSEIRAGAAHGVAPIVAASYSRRARAAELARLLNDLTPGAAKGNRVPG